MFTHNLNHVLFGETTAAGTATRQAITDNVGRVRAAVEEAFGQVIELLPSLVAMLVVLGVGFFVARLVARAVEALGDRIGINNGPGAFFHPLRERRSRLSPICCSPRHRTL